MRSRCSSTRRIHRIPEFDEVKTKVEQSLKQERAKSQLEQKARELAGALNNPGEMKAAGEKNGFEVATEEDFKLGDFGKAGTSPALDEAIFALKEGNVTKTPIKVGETGSSSEQRNALTPISPSLPRSATG